MARHKDTNWNLPDTAENWQQASVTVLMDIRDELKRANQLLANISSNSAIVANIVSCRNFVAIPTKLESIRRNTAKPKRKVKI